ncbi:unnamed protein product [Phytophthora lilii]|uniref:Unnamed protein product n=1 Tax=Phytophthora lilii TaxID=2077276 RepID=A0A9W6YH02_9STRA|nr:unnamed protein product [Phytophthora lilii]
MAPTIKIESLDEDEGRTRKIPAKWRQKHEQRQQQQRQVSSNFFDDGIWPESDGTEMHLGFNAFDFSASPEAFYDETEELDDLLIDSLGKEEPELLLKNDPLSAKTTPEHSYNTANVPTGENRTLPVERKTKKKLSMTDVAKQVESMGFNSASLWGRKLPGIRQLPSLHRDGVWGGCVHRATHSMQQRPSYRYHA